MPVSAKRITEIADEEIDLVLENEKYMVDTLYGEGGFVGDIVLPGNQRLAKYWSVTDKADVMLLTFPSWETWIRGGPNLYGEFSRPPVSPYWLNLLREPGLFKDTAADFVRLNTADQKRKAAGGEGETIPADRGQPQPVAEGGGPGSYG